MLPRPGVVILKSRYSLDDALVGLAWPLVTGFPFSDCSGYVVAYQSATLSEFALRELKPFPGVFDFLRCHWVPL
jgi:hypothetical protein